ncbi:hypothetical protein ACHAQA_008229 [Verticillium albo-atrum]
MSNHSYSASNKISGTLHNHDLSFTGNSFQGSNLYFNTGGGGSADLNCRKALFLTNPADDRGEVATDKPSLVRKVCEWILGHTNFKSWASNNTEPQLLWISGGSGMGKTMMSLFLLERLEMDEELRGSQDDILLFYFIDMRNEKRNTAVSLLRGLIHMLLKARPALMSHLLPDFEIQKEALFAKTSLEALWRIFVSMLRDPAIGTVRCLVDGLDECLEDSLVRLLRKITTLFEQERYVQHTARLNGNQNPAFAKLKLILVSREAPACILDNLAVFPRINISASSAGNYVPKVSVNQDTTPNAASSITKPDARLADMVRLAMQKKKASQDVNDPDTAHNVDQTPPQHSFATLSLGDSSSPQPAHNVRPEPVAQQAADQYTFDDPVEDDDEDEAQSPSSNPSNEQDTDSKVQWAFQVQPVEQSSDEEPELGQGSLEHYIDARVSELSEEMRYAESISTLVGAGLRSRGDGTFLWVDLAVDEIKRHPSQQVEDAVDQLLPGVDNMYSRSLLQIAPSLAPLAACLLRWVVAARRPMSLGELSAALTLVGFTASDPRNMVKQGVAACRGLLALKEEDGTVQLPHLSVKDFLTATTGPLWSDANLSQFHVNTAQVDSEIAAVCLRYLEQGCLAAGWVSGDVNDPAKQQRLGQFPLLEYAVLFWPDHLRTATHRRIDLNSPFFQHNSSIRKNWWLTYYNWTLGKSYYMIPRNVNLLHLAAYVNIPSIAQQMEDVGSLFSRLDSQDSYPSTPLDIAANMGNLEMFKFLLDRGADRRSAGEGDVFNLACAKGQSRILEYLLDLGYDLNQKTDLSIKEGFKSLAKSFRWAHGMVDEAMSMKRDHWSLLISDSGLGATALHNACMYGHASVVELFLQRGADISIVTDTGWTALHTAAWTGQLECVKVLLQHGADILVKVEKGLTALHCAASRGKTPVVSFLLESGTPVDEMETIGKTPLHLAVSAGWFETVEVLLSAGADVEAQSRKEETPLQVAVRKERPKAVQMLLAVGASQAVTNSEGKTPAEVLRAIKYPTKLQKEIIRILDTFGTPNYSALDPV